MTIADGSLILAADLDALTLADLVLLQADNARLPGYHPLTFTFQGLLSTTAANKRKARFVVPQNMLVDTLAVITTPANSAAATITATVSAGGILDDWSMSVTGALDTVAKKQARLLFDGTMSAKPGLNQATTSRVVRLLPKGAIVDVEVSTTNTLGTMVATIIVCSRIQLARGLA
jgi:hypothetical protein